MPSPFYVVLTTLPSRPQAEKLAQRVLQEKLAACVNVIGPARSFFWWEGKIDRAKEHLLLIKTHRSLFSQLRRFLEKNHPYEVPEIVALPIERGNAAYLDWIRRVIAKRPRSS